MAAIRVHLPRACLHRVCNELLHLGDYLLDEVALYVQTVQVLLELRVR